MESEPTTDETSPPRTEEGPLVAVSFEKDSERIRKYLESEPKALGITEVLLGVFQISMSFVSLRVDNIKGVHIFYIASSVFIMVAGVVAVAAKNLHLPTLKGCLAAQVVASITSILSLLLSIGRLSPGDPAYICWDADWNANKTHISHACDILSSAYGHYSGVQLLTYVAVTAISVTLAAYSCKVIECCSPKSRRPVIRINTA